MPFEFPRDRETPRANHQINVTPFIDVVLVLLVIFMVTAPLSAVRVPLELPASRAPPAPTSAQPVVLSVQQDLQLSLGDEPIARSQLAMDLDRATHSLRDTHIYVRADQALRYGQLMAVMDLLRDAGYTHIALVGREASVRSVNGAR